MLVRDTGIEPVNTLQVLSVRHQACQPDGIRFALLTGLRSVAGARDGSRVRRGRILAAFGRKTPLTAVDHRDVFWLVKPFLSLRRGG
jgi:hypothetical protein